MIVFDLACSHGHRFEGWFASGEEFERQADARLVRCPWCDDADVARLPSAKVSTKASRRKKAKPAPESPPPQDVHETIAGFPAELVAKLRAAVRNTENVGRRFPEEARKIHYEEAPARAIRGQASKEESEALEEEGIEFSSLPDFLVREEH